MCYLIIQAVPPCNHSYDVMQIVKMMNWIHFTCRFTHRNKKTDQSFFPRDIRTHKMLENEETKTVNINVLDFKGAVSVE